MVIRPRVAKIRIFQNFISVFDKNSVLYQKMKFLHISRYFDLLSIHFYTPVFRRDVLWYGDVCPSVHPSVRVSVRVSVSHSFPHFSPTCFDILSWNFACHFLPINIRSSSSVVNFRPFLLELCPFSNLKYWKFTVFRNFLQHALTYWAEILHMTLFCCTTDQVRVLTISVHFCRSYAPFGT